VGGSPWRSGAKRRSRVASRRGRSPQEAETLLRFILDQAVRRDSVRYRKVKELSRIKGLLSLCFPWKKFRRRFPLPRGLVPETTRDEFPKPRHQRFLIPRASTDPGPPVAGSQNHVLSQEMPVPNTTSLDCPVKPGNGRPPARPFCLGLAFRGRIGP
jgi:hypothetical protein